MDVKDVLYGKGPQLGQPFVELRVLNEDLAHRLFELGVAVEFLVEAHTEKIFDRHAMLLRDCFGLHCNLVRNLQFESLHEVNVPLSGVPVKQWNDGGYLRKIRPSTPVPTSRTRRTYDSTAVRKSASRPTFTFAGRFGSVKRV